MEIHYFYRREYDSFFYNIELVAWLEETEISRQGNKRLSFTQLERLRIFLSKDNESYHNHLIKHEFAENSCMGHYAHTRKELFEAMKKNLLLYGVFFGCPLIIFLFRQCQKQRND